MDIGPDRRQAFGKRSVAKGSGEHHDTDREGETIAAGSEPAGRCVWGETTGRQPLPPPADHLDECRNRLLGALTRSLKDAVQLA